VNAVRFTGIGGASGDMILAALVDLGADLGRIRALLSKLPVGRFAIEREAVSSHGLRGTRLHVRRPQERGHRVRANGHRAAHHHEHRTFADIRRLLQSARLPDAVRDDALAVFRRLANAEGAVHGVPAARVRFHEVGAVDSILDIVGACAARHDLGIDRVWVDPLPLGSGTVVCAHGVYPVPAPAVVELLKGVPVLAADTGAEMVTPTGAALLMEWRSEAPPREPLRIAAAGHGFGLREFDDRPNALRAVLLTSEAAGAAEAAPEGCLVLETNIDDCSPQLVGALADRLLAAGALDAFVTPVQMKKQRPGTLLTVLCETSARGALLDLIFTESTTIGVREYAVRRTVLPRRIETVRTPYGAVRVKVSSWQGRDVTRAPEMDDCIARARARGVPVRAVFDAARTAAGTATTSAPPRAPRRRRRAGP
jgi:uncharacterized protein (TIGR00299 family) protein